MYIEVFFPQIIGQLKLSAIDNNEIVGTLFIGLSKAFDLVNYDILLEKLKLYGVHESTVKWFSSYLKGRYQHTYVSGTLSNCGQVVSDVPQGSQGTRANTVCDIY